MIKIAFADWWQYFNTADNFITRALDGKIEYEITDIPDEADFVFCSVWKKECFWYKCPRIVFSGENCAPDFNVFDYAIGFDEISFGDRYIRYPLYIANYEDACRRAMTRPLPAKDDSKRKFCSFVVSNSTNCDGYRDELFENLSLYKRVDSGGRYKNNIGQPDGVADKLGFLGQYKFNIACENASHPGYCTEKIIEAFAANTVPIYWGDINVVKYFNPKAFINGNEYASIDEVVEAVRELDSDEGRYLEMLSAPVFMDNEYSLDNMQARFADWLLHIVSQDKKDSFRRCRSGFASNEERAFYQKLELQSTTTYKIKNKIKNIYRR